MSSGDTQEVETRSIVHQLIYTRVFGDGFLSEEGWARIRVLTALLLSKGLDVSQVTVVARCLRTVVEMDAREVEGCELAWILREVEDG